MMEPQGREVSPETFSRLSDTALETIWSWIQGRSTVRIDERDLRRYTKRTVRIIYQMPNAAGKGGRPRLVHKTGGAGPVDVNPVQDTGVLSVAHPNPENVQGDASLRVVSGVGMPEGFKVFRRSRRAPNAPEQGSGEGSWSGKHAAE